MAYTLSVRRKTHQTEVAYVSFHQGIFAMLISNNKYFGNQAHPKAFYNVVAVWKWFYI